MEEFLDPMPKVEVILMDPTLVGGTEATVATTPTPPLWLPFSWSDRWSPKSDWSGSCFSSWSCCLRGGVTGCCWALPFDELQFDEPSLCRRGLL